MAHPSKPSAESLLRSATEGFDLLFANDIDEARKAFASEEDSPFHLIGLGVVAFLQAALGMEVGQLLSFLRTSELIFSSDRSNGGSYSLPCSVGSRRQEASTGGKIATLNPSIRRWNGVGGHACRCGCSARLNPCTEVCVSLQTPSSLIYGYSESYRGYLQCL